MSTALQAMELVVHGANNVSKVEDVHLHMRLFLKEIGQKLEIDYAYLGPEGSQVTILVCKCKRTRCLAATQVPEKSMNVYALGFFTGWLRGLGWKTIVVEVRQ